MGKTTICRNTFQNRFQGLSRNAGKITAFLLFFLLYYFPFTTAAQEENDFDEVPIFFNVQRFGGTELTAVIRNETVYLPVTDVFNFLKIKNTISRDQDSISGFFLNQESLYLIDKTRNLIVFQGKTFPLKKGDLIGTETNLYLDSKYLGEIFGLDCAFSFRSLTVTLTTKLELPVIREMRQEQLRANINRLKGEIKADTLIKRTYPFFTLGMADWSVIATQQGGGPSDARFNLNLGTVLAGGEADISLNYNKSQPFTEKEQYYLWRFVNNDYRALRQSMVGKLYSQATASIFNPVVGVQFTNTPSTYRRSFGTYTLSDVTLPNWIVELYVNNVLVDYIKADASGFYKFEVPLVYGNSAVMLRFYGPWGEEKTREMNISIPFNFLPKGELEYNVSAGIVEDALLSRFSRTVVNYGVTRRLTMGGGLEYLSSVVTGAYMPFINSSLRIGNNLLLSGEYTHNVRFKGLMSYRLPSNLQLEMDYARYTKGQKAIIYNYLEERKAVVSIPVKSRNFSVYSRMTLNQIIMESMRNTNAELLLSGALYGVSTNFTTYGLFTNPANPYVYSNLSAAIRLPHRFVLTPQVQYEYMMNEVIATRANLEKSIFTHGFFNLSYEQNYKSKTNIVEMGLRYDLSFAQTGFSARQSNEQTSFVQSARGSLLYDARNHFMEANNRSSVGKGAITFVPFLDINCNGHRESDEPKVAGLNLRIDGGRMLVSEKDTTIRIVDLIPYTSYFVELNRNSFDNIAWQIKKQTLSIQVDANQFKSVEIPVAVMGEVSGTVYERTKNGKAGKGRILVNFFRSDSLVARVMSEADGYFSLLGLAPGPYQVKIDSVQLSRIDMRADPASLPVMVQRSKDGDVIDGLEFTLNPIHMVEPEKKPAATNSGNEAKITSDQGQPLRLDSAKKEQETIKVPTGTTDRKGSNNADIGKTKNTLLDGKVDSSRFVSSKQPESDLEWRPVLLQGRVEIQAGAFNSKTNAGALLRRLEKATGRRCEIVTEDGLYKVRLTRFKDRIEAEGYLPKLQTMGLTEAFVVGDHKGIVIQVDAFVFEQNAKNVQKKLINATGRKVKIFHEDGFYKVRIDGFSGRREAEAYLPGLIKRGYPEAFIIVVEGI